MFQNISNLISHSSLNTIYTSELLKSPNDIVFNVHQIPYTANKTQDIINIIQSYLNDKYKIIISLTNNEHLLSLQNWIKSFR